MLTHTHTHTFNGPFSRTTWVGRYQKGKTNLDFTEARDSGWQWHQLGICKSAPCSRQNNHASTSPLSLMFNALFEKILMCSTYAFSVLATGMYAGFLPIVFLHYSRQRIYWSGNYWLTKIN